MDLMVMVLLVGATAALILWPLLRATEAEEEPPPLPADGSREKELALAAIRELEFDYATGKISPEDYALLRARYEARALQAITRAAVSPTRGGEPDAEALLEAQIAARRRTRPCASCGGSLPQEARYCPTCGAPVGVEVPR
ncbi:MAG: hypothetical protein QN152_08800 [Armatimonadota bacterium]|nr:hypothetical protein [Armatimonadota bacterium]MDR7426567.1 hypothetical protein [Armatimonadota bacterium]MDR7463358.1 hypothetical protein [Armatimonadota bacterium]MDR7468587.1 hypothetical protein [Armatimonadota bacterium]MDR7475180.1 hypothetical protein [Armatimonadota bacterium]